MAEGLSYSLDSGHPSWRLRVKKIANFDTNFDFFQLLNFTVFVISPGSVSGFGTGSGPDPDPH